jgi:hypothetical protein
MLQDVLCTVNAQHNCSDNNCGTENTQHVYQEREWTDQTHPVVVHQMPEDLVLNTAQMQDVIHVQKFHHRSTSLVADEIITAIVAREAVTQKALQKSTLSVSKTAMVGM